MVSVTWVIYLIIELLNKEFKSNSIFCSIGSLGWDMNEAGVKNVTVKTATFTGTENGVRVKTWARPSNGFVTNVVFQHLVMVNVQNPVIIDQNYCPDHQACPHQVSK